MRATRPALLGGRVLSVARTGLSISTLEGILCRMLHTWTLEMLTTSIRVNLRHDICASYPSQSTARHMRLISESIYGTTYAPHIRVNQEYTLHKHTSVTYPCHTTTVFAWDAPCSKGASLKPCNIRTLQVCVADVVSPDISKAPAAQPSHHSPPLSPSLAVPFHLTHPPSPPCT